MTQPKPTYKIVRMDGPNDETTLIRGLRLSDAIDVLDRWEAVRHEDDEYFLELHIDEGDDE